MVVPEIFLSASLMVAKTKKRFLYLMVVRKIILFQDGDNGRKLSDLYERKNHDGSTVELHSNFRTSVMIPIREKNFFMCVHSKQSGGKGTVMIYIRGTYQSQNFPISQI